VISAREINEKQFHDAWRGYNQEEVDDFLDRVAEAIALVQRENDALRERVAELDQKVESAKTSEEMLKKTLESAQVAAQEAIATARAKAEEIVKDAEERAQRARDELRTRVETAEEEVRKRTAEIEQEQEGRRREIQESVDRLQAYEGELKRKLHGFLQQQSAALDILEAPEPAQLEVNEEPVQQETFDAAIEDLPDDPADSLIELDDDTSTADEPELAGGELEEDVPSLEDFGPFDDDAFESGRKRKRGLFRRDKDVEVSSEEV
jgi:DivIVA domain-containing protein